MFTFLKKAIAVAGLGGTLLFSGQTLQAADAPTTAPADTAVMCSGCKATWVQTPIYGKGTRIVGYWTREQMVCKDCKDAVSNFFATGKLEHSCKACDGTMQTCDMH